jgi:hypothetical protein
MESKIKTTAFELARLYNRLAKEMSTYKKFTDLAKQIVDEMNPKYLSLYCLCKEYGSSYRTIKIDFSSVGGELNAPIDEIMSSSYKYLFNIELQLYYVPNGKSVAMCDPAKL